MCTVMLFTIFFSGFYCCVCVFSHVASSDSGVAFFFLFFLISSAAHCDSFCNSTTVPPRHKIAVEH